MLERNTLYQILIYNMKFLLVIPELNLSMIEGRNVNTTVLRREISDKYDLKNCIYQHDLFLFSHIYTFEN